MSEHVQLVLPTDERIVMSHSIPLEELERRMRIFAKSKEELPNTPVRLYTKDGWYSGSGWVSAWDGVSPRLLADLYTEAKKMTALQLPEFVLIRTAPLVANTGSLLAQLFAMPYADTQFFGPDDPVGKEIMGEVAGELTKRLTASSFGWEPLELHAELDSLHLLLENGDLETEASIVPTFDANVMRADLDHRMPDGLAPLLTGWAQAVWLCPSWQRLQRREMRKDINNALEWLAEELQ